MKNDRQKKISFCITCMNRLRHIKETLKKNIEDNNLIGDVEFVLLDYNSSDNMEEWVKNEMKAYIHTGVLVYYKTLTPEYYHRSHSRNMVFRLANSKLLCNLDADNFLGEGFALEMIREFSIRDDIFYTSDCSSQDIFGRVIVCYNDFHSICGYNESLKGYGHEDVDLFSRLAKKGLTHLFFHNQDYYNVIRHSKEERIENEYFYKNIDFIYISYTNPYTSKVIFFYKNHTYEYGVFIDSKHLRYLQQNIDANTDTYEENSINEDKIILENFLIIDEWKESKNHILFTRNDTDITFKRDTFTFVCKGEIFYRVDDTNLKTEILIIRSRSTNTLQSEYDINKEINIDGYGKGTVFKNFNYDSPIYLT